MSLRVLYLDFNSFFASVEQQENSALRGKPVAVVPTVTDTTCCIAASIEAKRYGIRTGTLVREARRLCPDILLIHGQHALYVEYHERLIKTVNDFVPVTRIHSIDEMSLRLPGTQRSAPAARRLALQIKQGIRREIGECVRCSIGIAANTFLAKTAADMRKPDGLTLIEDHDLPTAFANLALRDFCGVGPNVEARLNRLGITTVAELFKASRSRLRKAWGSVEGEIFHAQLRGIEPGDKTHEQASLSHSHVLPPGLRNEADARAVAHRMLQKAAMRLRKNHLVTGHLHLSVRMTSWRRWSAEADVGPTQDTAILTRALDKLWEQGQEIIAPVAVGITLTGLRPDLSAPVTGTPPVTDRLNKRFGKNTLYLGSVGQRLNDAPMRIAFNRIPDTEVER